MKKLDPAIKRERMLEAQRQYAKKNSARVVATWRQWALENPDAQRAVWRAQQALKVAVRRGRLIRPTLCEECGQPGRRIEGAHRDYTRPLDVRWLCTSCHHRFDRRYPKTKAIVPSVQRGHSAPRKEELP